MATLGAAEVVPERIAEEAAPVTAADAAWQDAHERLRDLLSVEDDWDGEGARRPTSAAVGHALCFLGTLAAACRRLGRPLPALEESATREGGVALQVAGLHLRFRPHGRLDVLAGDATCFDLTNLEAVGLATDCG